MLADMGRRLQKLFMQSGILPPIFRHTAFSLRLKHIKIRPGGDDTLNEGHGPKGAAYRQRYASYDPATDKFSQHLLTTTNDFATTIDTTLATESNVTPVSQFDPYLGDFYDMTSVGDTFYGIFSASNADNGTDALFSTTSFQQFHWHAWDRELPSNRCEREYGSLLH